VPCVSVDVWSCAVGGVCGVCACAQKSCVASSGCWLCAQVRVRVRARTRVHLRCLCMLPRRQFSSYVPEL